MIAIVVTVNVVVIILSIIVSNGIVSNVIKIAFAQVTDLNDNHPVFEKESYTAIIPEEATLSVTYFVCHLLPKCF